MWWTDGSPSDDGRVGAAAVCKHGYEWRIHCCHLGTGCMEVCDAKLWAIRLALGETVMRPEALQRHAVKLVAVFSDLQATFR